MHNILLHLQKVHKIALVLLFKKKFTKPKIYTGEVDTALWNKLLKVEHNNAFGKNWYVYYNFIDDCTNKLKRMPYIKGGAKLCRCYT